MFPIHSHHVLTLQVLAIIWLNCSFHRFSHLTIFKDYAKTRLFHKFITSTWMIHCRQMKFRGLCLVLSCFTIWTIYPLILSFIFFIFISLYFMCGRAWYCWVLIWCIPAIFMCRQFELWTPVSLRWHWSEWPDTTDQSQTTVWSEEGVSQSVRFIIQDNKLRKYIEQVAIVKMIVKDTRN